MSAVGHRADNTGSFLLRGARWVGIPLLMALAACPASHPRPSPVEISFSGPKTVKSGDLLTFTVSMSSAVGAPLWTGITWGDGRHDEFYDLHGPCYRGTASSVTSSPIPPEPIPTKPIAVPDLIFSHRYRNPGTYTIAYDADEYRVCGHTAPRVTQHVVVHVTGPRAPGNGLADPVASVGIGTYFRDVMTGYLVAEDQDGYVRSMMVTWPDGTTSTYTNDQPCVTPANGWPSSHLMVNFEKPMARNSKVIKVEAISTDCAGETVQTLTSFRYFALSRKSWSNTLPYRYQPHDPVAFGEHAGY